VSTPVTASNDLPLEVEELLATLISPQWAATRAEALHDGSQVVQLAPRPDGGVVVAVSRELPSGGPGVLERFLPKDGRVVQTDDWDPAVDGGRSGRWRVEIPGVPASLGGTMRLEPLPAGSRYTIAGDVTVRVPLIGGKAERLIADLVGRLADKEAQLLRTVPPGP
jgi:hypothetical protein